MGVSILDRLEIILIFIDPATVVAQLARGKMGRIGKMGKMGTEGVWSLIFRYPHHI
jgi:hypothetical protein